MREERRGEGRGQMVRRFPWLNTNLATSCEVAPLSFYKAAILAENPRMFWTRVLYRTAVSNVMIALPRIPRSFVDNRYKRHFVGITLKAPFSIC